jgi:hypothetical protein
MSTPENINIRSVFSLIASADEKRPERTFYRTINGPKNLPEAVTQIELLEMVIKTSNDNDDNEVAKDAKEVLLKALTSTTSIKGNQLGMITTQRSQINVNDNRVKRGFMNSMIRPQPHREEE